MAKDTAMRIIDFAVKMEQDGEKFYRDLAARSLDRGLQGIFNGLADDEVKHAQTLRAFEKDPAAAMARTAILRSARTVFGGMAAAKLFTAASGDEKALYQQALELERRSRELYEAHARDALDRVSRDLFQRLAGEEAQHMTLLENMIEFISRPQTWLENAEFNHLEEY